MRASREAGLRVGAAGWRPVAVMRYPGRGGSPDQDQGERPIRPLPLPSSGPAHPASAQQAQRHCCGWGAASTRSSRAAGGAFARVHGPAAGDGRAENAALVSAGEAMDTAAVDRWSAGRTAGERVWGRPGPPSAPPSPPASRTGALRPIGRSFANLPRGHSGRYGLKGALNCSTSFFERDTARPDARPPLAGAGAGRRR
jgi:hypothetical protein